jgi:hypothetical protein
MDPDVNQDPDPVLIKAMQICDQCLQTPHDSIFLHASIVSVHGSSYCFFFEPLLFLNFDFHADPDMVQFFTLRRIWTQLPKIMQIYADPDSQPSGEDQF